MARVLIVGYGNPLRGDDGVGWRAADELRVRLSSPEVEIVRLHQLTPEVAEPVSRSEAVIFIDAAQDGKPGEVLCTPVSLPAGEVRFSHQLSPSVILALAKQLYGTSPRAFSVTLTGQCFEHGDVLSAVASDALPRLVARVEALASVLLSQEPVLADQTGCGVDRTTAG